MQLKNLWPFKKLLIQQIHFENTVLMIWSKFSGKF